MKIVDRGSGPPLVLIPGLQGRWEYMRLAVDALASSFRVITFSLDADDLDGYASQVERALTEKGIDCATICGVSFGGLVALRFAAAYPERCGVLVLASTPKPQLRLRPDVGEALPVTRAHRPFALQALRTVLSAPISIPLVAAPEQLIT